MADINDLVIALKNADAAGDTEAAIKLAAAVRAKREEIAASGSTAPPATPVPLVPKESVFAHTNPLFAAISGYGQGFTANFSDELAAGLKAGVTAPFSPRTFGQIYDEQLKTERANDALVHAEYPRSEFVGNMAGMVGPRGAISGIMKLGEYLPAAARSLPTWLKAAGAGAASGGLFGAGAAEGGDRTISDLVTGEAAPTSRLEGAATGAAVGGVLSPFVSSLSRPIMTGARNFASLVKDKLTQTPQREAQRLVADAVRSDILTPRDVLRLGRNPNLVVADLGENVAGLARGAASFPGAFRATATRFLRGRQEGQQGRLLDSLGVKGSQEFKDGFDKWAESRITAAKPAYDAAYAASFDASAPTFKALLQKPAMRDALREAERQIGNENGIKGGNVQRLDLAKRVLDDKAEVARRAGKGNEARMLGNIKNELLAEMDRQVPDYARARAIFSDHSSIRNAADLGTNLFQRATSHDDARRLVVQMVPSEFEAFRRGALRGLIDVLERSPENRNAAEKLIESTAVRDKGRLMFQDSRDFASFLRNAIDESRMSYTKNFVTGGSPTARIMDESRAIRQAGEIINDAASGNHLGLFGKALRALGFGQTSQETLNELGKILFSNPSRQQLSQLLRVTRTPLPGPISPATQLQIGNVAAAASTGLMD